MFDNFNLDFALLSYLVENRRVEMVITFVGDRRCIIHFSKNGYHTSRVCYIYEIRGCPDEVEDMLIEYLTDWLDGIEKGELE